MKITSTDLILMLFIILFVYGSIITLVVLAIRALIKYLRGDKKGKNTAEKAQAAGDATATVESEVAASEQVLQSLGEALKNARIARKFTQEYVADTLGVSRQAVSKWENGTSDPSTSNLIALAKLYEVSVETLLAGV